MVPKKAHGTKSLSPDPTHPVPGAASWSLQDHSRRGGCEHRLRCGCWGQVLPALFTAWGFK